MATWDLLTLQAKASNCRRVDAVALGNGCHIGPLLRLDFLLNGVHAVFRAKHDMNVMGHIRAGHCGYLHTMLAYPSKPWRKGAFGSSLSFPGTSVPGSGLFRPFGDWFAGIPIDCLVPSRLACRSPRFRGHSRSVPSASASVPRQVRSAVNIANAMIRVAWSG